MSSKTDEAREIYVKWAAMLQLDPTRAGKEFDFFGLADTFPETSAAVARVIGVSEMTTFRWGHDERVQTEVRKACGEYELLKLRGMSELFYAGLRAGMEQGDARFYKLYKELRVETEAQVALDHGEAPLQLIEASSDRLKELIIGLGATQMAMVDADEVEYTMADAGDVDDILALLD